MGFTIIQLISTDPALHRLCKDTLGDLRRANLHLVINSSYVPIGSPSICIWDCKCSLPADGGYNWSALQKDLLLIDRDQVQPVLERFASTPVGVLLKPVTPATLRAFLEQTVPDGAGTLPQDVSPSRAHSDRDDILQYLLQANLRLQEYDQDRTNFLARALHDLRAPLTALNGYCGLMLEGALGTVSPDQRDVLQRMQHSAKRLTQMASALYDLSIARRMPMRLRWATHPIEDCIERAIQELGLLIEDKDLAVTVHPMPHCDADLCFDDGRIEQLLLNVIENACRFTPKLGSVEISGYPYFWERRAHTAGFPAERRCRASHAPNSFRVDIKDGGPPIPDRCLPALFEEYTPCAGPGDRSGTGLGLAVSRTIAQAHGGCLWATSGESGVTFSFVLPLCSPDPGPYSVHAEIVGVGYSRG
jgi:signal transduction histidine kinase